MKLKTTKTFTKGPIKFFLEIQRIRITLEDIISCKIGLKDEIENI
jgi:hypothetical protein